MNVNILYMNDKENNLLIKSMAHHKDVCTFKISKFSFQVDDSQYQFNPFFEEISVILEDNSSQVFHININICDKINTDVFDKKELEIKFDAFVGKIYRNIHNCQNIEIRIIEIW